MNKASIGVYGSFEHTRVAYFVFIIMRIFQIERTFSMN